MSYINSEHISIFPFSKIRNNKDKDRLFYENNIAGIIRQLIDTEGFIITAPEKIQLESSLDSKLEFNLHGYNIIIDEGAYIFESVPQDVNHIYAEIILDTSGVTPEISGQDVDNYFEGLEIIATKNKLPSSENNKYRLELFELIDNIWVVCQKSKLKFNSNVINITGIDGRH